MAADTYEPLWVEEKFRTIEGKTDIRRSGMDYYLLETLANTLNFTFGVRKLAYWSEVCPYLYL